MNDKPEHQLTHDAFALAAAVGQRRWHDVERILDDAKDLQVLAVHLAQMVSTSADLQLLARGLDFPTSGNEIRV